MSLKNWRGTQGILFVQNLEEGLVHLQDSVVKHMADVGLFF